MRSLHITMFVLLMLVLTTQTFRHVYVKWIEPTGSVLDEFREPVEQEIVASDDLAELKARYAKAHAARHASEASKPLREIDLERRTGRPVYAEEQELRAAIERVEGHEKARFQLWFYWLCGLASVAFGLLAYTKLDPWVGVVGMITGFVEMTVWTSPLWRSFGPQRTFDQLLTLKLALSAATLGLLVATWLLGERRRRALAASGRAPAPTA